MLFKNTAPYLNNAIKTKVLNSIGKFRRREKHQDIDPIYFLSKKMTKTLIRIY